MGDVITQSTIWKFVGRVSSITGLVCFALSSSYDMSFGKLGYGGHLVYLLLCLIMWRLIVGAKRIRVSERVQGVVAALIFVVICVISVVLDKYVPGKSDAFTITSYGSFALMSVSLSRKLELGFETGFSAFFLQLFASQLFKIKGFLLPIALVFCSLIIILRHYSESGVQFGSGSLNGYDPIEESRIEISGLEDINEEGQDSLGMGEVSGQSLLSTDNQQNNQEEYSQATHHSPRIVQVSDESILEDWVNQNQEEEDPWSLPPESWEQEQVSSGNNQNGWMHSSAEAELFSAEPSRIRRRSRWVTTGIQNIPSRVGATLGRWRWWEVVPAFVFFFF